MRAREMSTFSPTSPSTHADVADAHAPHLHHQHLPPPEQQQQQHHLHNHNGPFSHQLNPPTSTFAAHNTPHISRRASRDLRHQPSNGAMAGANGNGPVAVPGGRMGNGHSNSNGQDGNMRGLGFTGARSPPNNKSAWRELL